MRLSTSSHGWCSAMITPVRLAWHSASTHGNGIPASPFLSWRSKLELLNSFGEDPFQVSCWQTCLSMVTHPMIQVLTFFQVSPISKIMTVNHKYVIMSNNNDKSVLSETHKVVALGWCKWEDSMKLVLEMHDRSEGRWKMVGFVEQISTWAVKWRWRVFCECSFYCVGLHHRKL